MEEDAYREAYREANALPCVFEKALLLHCAACENSGYIHLAEREAIACASEPARAECAALLEALGSKAQFALKLTSQTARLPHAKLVRLQCGGLQGLYAAVYGESASPANIYRLLQEALKCFGGLEHLPYAAIMRAVGSYPVRGKSL